MPWLRKIRNKIYFFFKVINLHVKVKQSKKNKLLKIVVGASGVFEPGWIDTDAEYLNLLKRDHWDRFFKKNSIDVILAEHVWEHLIFEDGFNAAKICFPYLKQGGYLRIAVPDGFHPSKSYLDAVKVNGSGSGADDHKVLYNYKTLQNLFERAGYFVKLQEYYDEYGQFHFENWKEADGKIYRSMRFDERNQENHLTYTSIILDAHKV